MNCQNCNKNTATIHLTEITNGKRREKHLCESCAQSDGIAINAQIPLNDLLNNLLAAQPKEKSVFDSKNTSCPKCNITMDKINDQSLLGCPEDYDIFNESLNKIIDKCQDGGKVHCGKVPQNKYDETTQNLEMANLKQALDEAIRQERYEDAAQLRDKINQVK